MSTAISRGRISITKLTIAFFTCGLSIPFIGIRKVVLRTKVS